MYGAVLQCLHSGYKLLLQLPHGVIYGVKEATSNSTVSNDLSLSKGWA